MKREVCQNGMLRNYHIVPTSINQTTRTINPVASIPTAGMVEKMKSLKPTSHSMFTGKCGNVRRSDCHLKFVNGDVSRMRLVTWRVVDTRLGLGMSFCFGTPSSASEIMKRLDEGNDVVGDMIEVDGVDEIGTEMWMDGEDRNGDEDETTSFCEVGYVWEQVDGDDDDSWCLVAEM